MASNKPPSPVPIRVSLAAIEVVSDLRTKTKKSNLRLDHFALVSVDDENVESEKYSQTPFEWKWQNGHKFLFHPSSTIKIEIKRKSRFVGNHSVGQYTAKVIELLDNDAIVDLKDKTSNIIMAKIKINLSLIDTDFRTLIEDVSHEVSLLGSPVQPLDGIPALLGMAWSLTKNIMDNIADAHPILKTSWTIISYVYKTVQQVEVQDDTIRNLAERLQEVLGVANQKRDLLMIEGTTDVIKEIGRTSLTAVSLIHKYTKSSFPSRLLKSLLQDPTSPIAQCHQSFDELLEKFSTRLFLGIDNAVADIQSNIQSIKDDALVEKIKQWLCPPDSSMNFNAARKVHQEGTSSWFLDGPWFRESREKAGLLWIKGTTGSGKTILCSSIVAKVIGFNKASNASNAYFFFDGRDGRDDLQLHDKLIRSLVWQLSLQFDNGILPDLADLYRSCKSGSEQPTTNALQDTLHTIITDLHSVFIIIDSLDECTTRDETLTWIRQINSLQMDNLHMVVTSRPERDISEVLESLDLQIVDLIHEPANDDIRKYLQRLPKLERKWDTDTLNAIRLELTNGAGRMFRWAALQITELEKCSREDALMEQLHNLPKDLTATYTKMLSKFDSKNDQSDIETFLRWLIYATRPMSLVELAETVVVDFSGDEPRYSTRRRYRDPRDVLEKCEGLITESEGRVTLAHVSVKEYLLSADLHTKTASNFRFTEKLSHSFISQTCLAYLLQFDSLDQDMVKSSPLAYYAADHWILHAKEAGINKSQATHILNLAGKLFSLDDPPLINWIRILRTMHFEQKTSGLAMQLPFHTPLSAGFFAPLEQSALEPVGTNGVLDDSVNAQKEYRNSALLAAIYLENEGIVKLMLENGADVNAESGSGGHGTQAISLAIYQKNEGIINLLLANAADINALGMYANNALLNALCEGDEKIVKLLLDNGVDVNCEGPDGDSALIYAIFEEKEGIAKLLLDYGADVNTLRHTGGNALSYAKSKGNEEIVKLLLDYGAEEMSLSR